MGLDITAYESVDFVRPRVDGEEEREGEIYLYSDDHFRDRADGLADGIYQIAGKHLHVRAGSYSGYNEWRDQLARMIGTTADRVFAGDDKPIDFYELINFSDCEGFIGPKTCAKLAADFAKHHDRAVQHGKSFNDMDYWIGKYHQWSDAFALAASMGKGIVEFH